MMTASQFPVAMRLVSVLPFVLLEIVLGGHEDVRAGIEGEQFRRELAQHVVGNGKEGFAGQPKAFQFHRRGDHRVGLPGANHMGQQAVGGLEDAPDAGPLVWMQGDGGTGARQTEVIAVEGAQADVVELVVVFAGEAFPALVVLPDPLLEAVLDFLLLVACGLGGRGIDDIAFGGGVVIIDRGSAEIQGVVQQFERAAAVGSPLGCIGDAETDTIIALNCPKSKLGGVAHENALFAEQFLGKPADVPVWYPNAPKPRVNLGCREVGRLDLPECFNVRLELPVCHGGGLRDCEFGPHVARKVFVLGFPQIGLRIEKDGSLEVGKKLRGLPVEQV